MIKQYRFTYPAALPEAFARLDAAVQADHASGMRLETSCMQVKIQRRLGPAFLNGFAPIFVGTFTQTPEGTELRGRFRFHLVTIALFAGLVGLSIYTLLNVLLMPTVPAGYPEGWKSAQIRFELQFIGASCLAAFVAWIAGRPQRNHIVSLIEASTRAAPEAKSPFGDKGRKANRSKAK